MSTVSFDSQQYQAKLDGILSSRCLASEKVARLATFSREEILPILVNQQTQLNDLQYQLSKLLAKQFGASSEKQPSRPDLLEASASDEETDTDTDADTHWGQQLLSKLSSLLGERTSRVGKKKGKTRPSTKARFSTLPEKKVVCDLPESEKICACGHALHVMSEQVVHRLEYTPDLYTLLTMVCPQYGCRGCEMGVKQASAPMMSPLNKIPVTSGFLTHLLLEKYAYHLPLYRQAKRLDDQGIAIDDKMLSRWVLKAGELLMPVVDALGELLEKSAYIQADETPCQVLSEKDRGAQQTSYLWVYRFQGEATHVRKQAVDTGWSGVLYTYHPTRSGSVVQTQLSKFQGYLQSDAYSGYNHYRKEEESEVITFGCMAHARRKFSDIVKTHPNPEKVQESKAYQAISFIQKLYLIERRAKEKQLLPVARQALREAEATPILEVFKTWLDHNHEKVPKESPIGKAIRYTRNQWEELTRYVHYGLVEIDNNGVENAIRPVALGRRNWLFATSPKGMKVNATIYSLLATCQLNEVDPFVYFTEALNRVQTCKTPADYQALLPHVLCRQFPDKKPAPDN